MFLLNVSEVLQSCQNLWPWLFGSVGAVSRAVAEMTLILRAEAGRAVQAEGVQGCRPSGQTEQ